MAKVSAKSEQVVRFVVTFLSSVFLSFAALLLLGNVMYGTGSRDTVEVICMVISLQISLLTTFYLVIEGEKHERNRQQKEE